MTKKPTQTKKAKSLASNSNIQQSPCISKKSDETKVSTTQVKPKRVGRFGSKKKLSVHVPTKIIPTDNQKFGDYLAGLLDGDGHFSTSHQCIIVFDNRDRSSAYKMKELLKYGSVKPVKDKNAVALIITGKAGLLRVANLVHNKLRHPNRIHQFNTRIIPHYNFPHGLTENTHSINWNSHWFSGFFDADGFFHLYHLSRQKEGRSNILEEIRLKIKIDQKGNELLNEFLKYFGGFIGIRKKQNTYYYESTSFESQWKVLSYFDTFHLVSPRRYLTYLRMRKAYLIVQENQHYTQKGLEAIKKLRALIHIGAKPENWLTLKKQIIQKVLDIPKDKLKIEFEE